MQTVAPLLLAFLGYSIMNLGQAGQKIGLEKRYDRPAAGWSLWVGATATTLLSVLIVLIALSIGAVSLVGAMAGSGLVTLAIFSHFVMGESIDRTDVAGIAVIIAGSVLIGLFAPESQEPTPRWLVLHLSVGGLIVAYVLAWILGNGSGKLGLIVGGFAGALAGASMLYQNATTITAELGALISFPLSESVTAERLLQFLNPYLVIWLTLSMAAFFVLQIAYGRGKAIHVIPAFNVNFIVIPVLGGVVGFSETVNPLQWVGVATIVAGTVLLTSDTEPGLEYSARN